MISKVGFAAEIEAFAKERGPLTIGLAGAGQMGIDIVLNLSMLPGVRVGAVSETRRAKVQEAMTMSGRGAGDVVFANTPAEIDRAIEMGKLAIIEDYRAMCAAGRIDAIIDATGNPNSGAEIALETIRNGKPIVMLNVEADITVGRYLKEEARKAGVVYTGAAGDEPQATIELIGFAQSIGLEIISAGKGKNNALDFDATPDQFEAEAHERNMNPRMLVEFVDGSKTMVEMTAIGNATGLTPDIPGMHGPNASLENLAATLCTKEDGGVLSRAGCVDYTIGKGVAPGVFCVVKPRHPRLLERMVDLKVGPGPNFALVRPFHLTSMEAHLTAFRAVKYHQPDIVPLDYPVAECGAVAKRDLQPGHSLGRIGQYDYRGFNMSWVQGRQKKALPMGLAERSKVLRPIKKGELLTYDNCAPDETLVITQIRRKLDAADARFL